MASWLIYGGQDDVLGIPVSLTELSAVYADRVGTVNKQSLYVTLGRRYDKNQVSELETTTEYSLYERLRRSWVLILR